MPDRPFSVRGRVELWDGFDGPHPGVPSWLQGSLVKWVLAGFTTFEPQGPRVLDRAEVLAFQHFAHCRLPTSVDSFVAALRADAVLLLDATDWVLGGTEPADDDRCDELTVMLRMAGSAYVVGRSPGGRYQLQEQLTPEGVAAGSGAMAPQDRAAEHLREAWSKVFGRPGDPDGACAAAVLAVEAAAGQTVTPDHGAATLGTMIQAMRDGPARWSTPLDSDHDIAGVVAMMELVWFGGQGGGDETTPAPHTKEAGQAVVLVAVTLVQWFRCGFVAPVA